jgi:alkylation response protein AidB-like acyl-CoA dehydrogenase
MDFDLSKPQKLLQSSVREFLSRECPSKRVRQLMESSTAFDQNLWQGLADQGWTGLTIPEAWDGLGLSAVELAVVTEVMGDFCLPGPFLSNLWGATVIRAANNEELARRYLGPIAAGSMRATVALLEDTADWNPERVSLSADPAPGGFRLQGEKLFVSDAETADIILWPCRIGEELAIFSLDQKVGGLTVTPMPAIDPTRKLYRVSLQATEVPQQSLLARGEAALSALRLATLEATSAVCAELVGVMSWLLRNTVEYAKARHQFGRPVGAFQAVQHRCADMFLQLESARSAAYYASWAVSVQDAEAERLVSVAKAYCSDVAREVGNSAIQVHGGIGFTWEHDLQLYYKRAKSSEVLFGDATYHRERIARIVIDGG